MAIDIEKRYNYLYMNLKQRLFLFRILISFSIIYYLPWGFVFPFGGEKASPPPAAETEIGMGGGMLPESIPVSVIGENNLEFLGVPEPEEYSKPKILTFTSYKIEKGDTIGEIAMRAGLNQDTLLSVNKIKNSRLIQIGQVLKIPNQDGIYYAAAKNDTLVSIGEKYKTEPEAIVTVNELFSDSLKAGASLFIPGAQMDWVNRQEINGDLFIWPVSGYITSLYGYRQNPFGGGKRQFHSGLDVGAITGTPVRAAMAGRVSAVAYDNVFGNYAVVSHHSGYRTLYAHMSAVRVKAGAYVNTGERIGSVGSTGLSTGPHLHFTVYKNGVTVNPRSLMK